MKTIYIRPCCEIIRICTDTCMLAGSPNHGINPDVDKPTDNLEDITGPEYGGTDVPTESKLDPGYNIWEEEY